MNSSITFDSSVYPFTLGFKNPHIEAKHQKIREEEIKSFWLKVLLVSVFVFMSSFMLLRMYSDSDPQIVHLRWVGWAILIIFFSGFFLEMLVHSIKELHLFRGAFLVISMHFICFLYTVEKYEDFVVPTGSLTLFILAFIFNWIYAHNWIYATFIYFVSHLFVTSYVIIRKNQVGNVVVWAVPLINLFVFSLVAPVFYFLLEKIRRKVTFLMWDSDRERKFWKRVVNFLPVGIIIQNQGTITYFNDDVKKLFNMNNEAERRIDQLKKKLRFVKMVNSPHCSLYETLVCNSGRENTQQEEKYIFDNGEEEVPLAVSVLEFTKSSESYRVFMLQNQKLLEELQQERVKREAQKKFLAMITHELRNPLNSIMGIFETFMDGALGPELTKNCQVGMNSAKLMLNLVNDILDISQLNSNKFRLAPAPNNFVEVAQECLSIMAFPFQQKGLNLKLFQKSFVPTITNDSRRYSQILLNLLSNSLKFTSEGGVTVHLEYKDFSLETSVTDTGMGIPPDKTQMLFKEFARIHSVQENPQGIGLGLNVCKRLSEEMGGGISAKSVQGVGTTMIFSVKNLDVSEVHKPNLLENAEETKDLNESTAALIKEDESNRKGFLSTKESIILIADDDYSSSFLLRMICNSAKSSVDVATSGEEALAKAKKRLLSEPYQLFFVDMYMPPGINGLETASRLKELYSQQKVKCTIVGVTGDWDEELHHACKEVGMTELLVKPFSRDSVLKIIRTYT